MRTTTVLILDGQSVAKSEGVTFHLNTARKHPENPVMRPGLPHEWDSLQISWPATVLYDPEEDLFRCWYSGLDVVQSPGRLWRPGYAESPDGIHWMKPALGQVPFLEGATNQISVDWDFLTLSLVFLNPHPAAPPSQRFGSYWTEALPRGSYVKGLAWSPDGVRWTHAGAAYGPHARSAFQDISQLLFDGSHARPDQGVRGYTQILAPRPWDGRLVRNIGLVHGPTPEHVEDAVEPVVLEPVEGIDEELHFASVTKAGDTYVMLFESGRFAQNPIDGDLRLAVSADGLHFRRVHPDSALVDTGPKGMWDENLLVTTTAAMQLVDESVYIHYIGCPSTYNSWPAEYAASPERRGSMFAPAYLGLATLPMDRFACARGPGTLTSSPIALGGGGVWLNADGEGIRVIAVDRAGRQAAEGQLKRERHEGVYREVIWATPTPPVGDVRLRVSLPPDAKLYSLRFG